MLIVQEKVNRLGLTVQFGQGFNAMNRDEYWKENQCIALKRTRPPLSVSYTNRRNQQPREPELPKLNSPFLEEADIRVRQYPKIGIKRW